MYFLVIENLLLNTSAVCY